MSYKITLQPSGHTLTAHENETVLDAALREGYTIAYGCRNGACGACKGRVVQGQVRHEAHGEKALSEAEKANGMALFCRAVPQSDLVIEAREINGASTVAARKLPCRVQKMERLSDDVMALSLKLPDAERLRFFAGQYIDILLKDGARRSLSIANAPHDDAFLQLHLRNYGGMFSKYVFETLRERDILRFEGPLGAFFLREDSDKPIILLASGTGFAPIKAIIEHSFHQKLTRPITFYWGGRARADLYMHALAEEWARAHAHFKYVPVLSEPKASDAWQGRTGFVHRAVMQDFPDLSGHQVYACGAPIVVQSAHDDFIAQCRLPADAFFADAFTPAATPAAAAAASTTPPTP